MRLVRHPIIRLCVVLLTAVPGCGPDDSGEATDAPEAADASGEPRRDLPPGVLVDAREWHVTDTGVDTRGLDIRFGDEDDDVEIWSGDGDVPSGLAGRRPFVLADSFRTFRVENRRFGVGFELRARGTGSTVGATIEVGVMRALGEGPTRYGGQVESGETSVGDWIEVEHARLVRLDDDAARGDTTGAGGDTAGAGSPESR